MDCKHKDDSHVYTAVIKTQPDLYPEEELELLTNYRKRDLAARMGQFIGAHQEHMFTVTDDQVEMKVVAFGVAEFIEIMRQRTHLSGDAILDIMYGRI